MKKLSYSCSLRSFLLVSPYDAGVSEPLFTALYTKPQLMEIIQDSLKNLKDLCSTRTDLKQAVTQMYNASVNWERASPDYTEGSTRLRDLYPTRSPLPWLPSMTMDILNRDPLDILFAADYNALATSCNLTSLAVMIPFGLMSRAHMKLDVIDRLQNRDLSPSHESRASDVMKRYLAGPMALANYILASEEVTQGHENLGSM